jgi:GNAT superfamily N-acetyltransferase
MDLHPVDVRDEAALRAWHAARQRTHDHDRPHAPFFSADEAVAIFSREDPEERFVPLVAEERGRTVGTAIVFVPLLDNLDKAYCELEVVPGHRGQGVGDGLMSRVLEVGEDEGRKLMIAMAYVPHDADETHAVHRFAARHRFAVGNVEVRRSLELPVPDERLQAWADEARPHHEGYRIATYVDWVPEQLRASYVELQNQLTLDAPTGDIDFEAGARTVEVYEEQTRNRVATGRTVITTVAVRDGRAVAHSTLSVPPGRDAMPHLHQWGTYVHREHRGHRLGLAVKAANLRAVQEMHPERTLISTSNSPVNGPMVAINEKLGFRPVETSVEFVRAL